MKVNNVNTQYEIPGFDIAPQSFEPGEDDDFEGAPYSRDPGLISPLLRVDGNSFSACCSPPPHLRALPHLLAK